MSKIIDGLMGFVVGDAMGVPVEFSMREKMFINPVTDMIGYGSHNVPAGTWSDDTSMTIALIDSINNKNKIDYDDIMNNFKAWFNDAKYTPADDVFDIGRTCLKAIGNYSKGINPLECGLKDINDNGNGSLMRISPIAYYCYYNNLNDNEILKLVNDISSLTHAHEISLMGCYIYIKYLIFLLEGNNKLDAYHKIQNIDYSFYSNETIIKYERILKNNIYELSIDEIKSSGYIVDTLEASLWVLLNTDNYKHAIIGSINLGNDTDTIGAICGSMAGLIYGYEDIEETWINTLIKKDYLIDIFNQFENNLCHSKKDAILGAIIGDIVGSRFELNHCKKKKFDFMPYGKSRFTDDTVMTLAVAKTLLNYPNNNLEEEVINNMVEIGRKYHQCGFGRSFHKWITTDNHEPYNSYGNGAAMRISACGIVAKNKKEVKEISKIITSVSHNHPDGIKGAEAVAMMIYLIKEGKNKEELKQYFIENYYPIDFTLKDLIGKYKFKIACKETVPQAFMAFYESINFEDAIRKAMYIGGDSDTIGAICGSMAGLYYGIPNYIYEDSYKFLDDYLLDIYNSFNTKYNELKV